MVKTSTLYPFWYNITFSFSNSLCYWRNSYSISIALIIVFFLFFPIIWPHSFIYLVKELGHIKVFFNRDNWWKIQVDFKYIRISSFITTLIGNLNYPRCHFKDAVFKEYFLISLDYLVWVGLSEIILITMILQVLITPKNLVSIVTVDTVTEKTGRVQLYSYHLLYTAYKTSCATDWAVDTWSHIPWCN